jgi:hypothetical protein
MKLTEIEFKDVNGDDDHLLLEGTFNGSKATCLYSRWWFVNTSKWMAKRSIRKELMK